MPLAGIRPRVSIEVGDRMLLVNDISYGYGRSGPSVLEGISFRLRPKEMLAVIGPNASGKSTLLNCISGLYKPRRGDVVLDGKSIYSYPPKERARRVAVVPQDIVAAFDFNVVETVLMGRIPHLGLWEKEKEADIELVNTVMKQTGVSNLAERFVRTLSGGEKQRTFIARALAQEPQLLLLDEPTSQLDIAYQAEILGLLRSLNEQGLTILAVIHDLNLATQYFDKFVLLGSGRIIGVGTAAQVITRDNLQKAYGNAKVEITVSRHPRHHRPFVTVFLAESELPRATEKRKGAVK